MAGYTIGAKYAVKKFGSTAMQKPAIKIGRQDMIAIELEANGEQGAVRLADAIFDLKVGSSSIEGNFVVEGDESTVLDVIDYKDALWAYVQANTTYLRNHRLKYEYGYIYAKSHANYNVTPYINVEQWDGIAVDKAHVDKLAWYDDFIDLVDTVKDENHNQHIAGHYENWYDGSITAGDDLQFLVKPAGAKWVRMGISASAPSNIYFFRRRRALNWLKIDKNTVETTEGKQDVWGEDCIDYLNLIGDGFVNGMPNEINDPTGKSVSMSSGKISSSTNSVVSNFINIEGIKKVLLGAGTKTYAFYSDLPESEADAHIDDVFISGGDGPTATQPPREVAVPNTAKYMRVGMIVSSTRAGQTYCKKHTETYSFDWSRTYQSLLNHPLNAWRGKKVAWLGTSIPAGSGTIGETYPRMLANELGFTLIEAYRAGQKIHAQIQGGVYKAGNGATCMTIAEYIASGDDWTDTWVSGKKEIGFHSWENIFSENNYPEYYKYTKDGKTETKNYYPREAAETPFSARDIDVWVFDVMSNNSGGADTSDWDNFDLENWKYKNDADPMLKNHRETYLGAMIYVITKLWTLNPLARVVFIGWDGNAGATIVEQSKELCAALNIPYLEVMQNSNVRSANVAGYKCLGFNTAWFGETHPTDLGHHHIKEILKRQMLITYPGDLAVDKWGKFESYNKANIMMSGKFDEFDATAPTAGTPQYINVAGNKLNNTKAILVTPPAGFEFSTDESTWYDSAQEIAYNFNDKLYLRLKGATAGNYGGWLILSYTGIDVADVRIWAEGTVK